MNRFSAFLFILGVTFIAGSVGATVGGPTYISSIAWSVQDNSVYYIVHDQGGRGCPPIINKINVSTMARGEVKSCDQWEAEPRYDGEGPNPYGQFTHDIYQNLPYLWSVSLEKNNIDVKVKFLSKYAEADMDLWSEFQATVLQDNKELGKINFRGCSETQPHIFEGYMVPDTNAMALLVSNKGDCFEGGYVKETLHIIKGVQYRDQDPIRTFKEESATEPNEGNVVAYAEAEARPDFPPPAELPVENPNNRNYAVWAGITILGIVLGYFFGTRFKK